MSSSTTYTVTIKPAAFAFTVANDETILAAALRQGIDFPHRCQQGVCTSCVCKRIEGQVRYNEPQPDLNDKQNEQGFTYCCLAYPISDITLHHPFISEPK